MNLSLLHTPDGVRDIYGKELEYKNRIIELFQENIIKYGYDEIQTPTLEFLKVFSEENDSMEQRMFRYIDRDGETLVIRPDFTPSVARCAAKYFENDNIPLRFFYKGNSFINKGAYEGKAIEVTEMGIELMKDDSYIADAEVLKIVIENLEAIGLDDYKIVLSTRENNGLERLEKTVDLLKSKNVSDKVYIDLTLESNFKYYTGMIFKVYTYGVGDSICKGGRYNSLLSKFGTDAPAVGCVFMVDDILQSLRRQKISVDTKKLERIFVLYNEDNAESKMKTCDDLRKYNKSVCMINEKQADDNFRLFCKENNYEII